MLSRAVLKVDSGDQVGRPAARPWRHVVQSVWPGIVWSGIDPQDRIANRADRTCPNDSHSLPVQQLTEREPVDDEPEADPISTDEEADPIPTDEADPCRILMADPANANRTPYLHGGLRQALSDERPALRF